MTDSAAIIADFNKPEWVVLDVAMTPDTYVVVLARMTCDCSPDPNRIEVISGYAKDGSFFTNTSCTFEALAWAPSAQPEDFFNKGKVN